MKTRIWIVAALMPFLVASLNAAAGDSMPASDLASRLRGGGYVILMRHASAPLAAPDPGSADPDNRNRERQLDQQGRASARAFGDALRRLRIPIGTIWSSPTYRALETVRLAQLGTAAPLAPLGDSGQSMVADQSATRGAWLRARAAQSPMPRTNTLIVTHLPNILEAYPAEAAGLADGEALILHPDGRGRAPLVARVAIGDWSQLHSGR